jgi:chromosomal replication initiation ATPase DnaA
MNESFKIAIEIYDQYPDFFENGIKFEDVYEYVKWWLKNNVGSEISINTIIDVESIEEVVCSYFGISKEEIESKTNKRETVTKRQIWQAFSYMLLNDELSLSEIGQDTGGFDHATVLNSKNRVNNLIATNKKIRYDVMQIEKRLKNRYNFKKSILNSVNILV